MKQSRRLFNLVKGEARFELKAQTDAPAQMFLYDEISYWGVMAADFVSELVGLNGADVDLHVNSPGGDVFEGLAMLNSLRAYPGKVTAYVDGIAASAASFLIMGADEVVMQPNTEIMIHDAWGMCLGNSADMIDMAQRLDKVSDNIADVYRGKAGGAVAEWRQRMKDEGWYGPDEALELGLVDRVGTASSQVDNAFDLSKFKNKKTSVAPEPEFDWDPQEFLRAFEEAWK